MTDNFLHLTFSIFTYNDIVKFSDVVNELFLKQFQTGTAKMEQGNLCIDLYYNQIQGGLHKDIFSFWKTNQLPQKIIFFSNSSDGRFTLCNVIHQKLKCDFVLCSLSNDRETPMFLFHYANSIMEERDIIAYKDSRWFFHEQGKPLKFENLNFYKRKYIKERLNNEIILYYLKKLGIDFYHLDSDILTSYTCERQNI